MDKKITVKELRHILFDIDDQTMTIKELRQHLFDVENQDTELTPELLMSI